MLPSLHFHLSPSEPPAICPEIGFCTLSDQFQAFISQAGMGTLFSEQGHADGQLCADTAGSAEIEKGPRE